MDLDLEWKEKVAENWLPEEEQKVEKEYLHKLMQIMTKLRSLNKSEDFLKILKKKNWIQDILQYISIKILLI